MDDWESDRIVEQWLHDQDELTLPLPNIDSEPHLLISKVRKHYMEYLIKLLSINYESHQMLINKNIYLPSAIWRCAKTLEMSAARSSMVIQLYRQNIISVIKDLKENTKKGKLNRKLYDCLRISPENEKKTQTNKFIECNCKCTCSLKKKSKRPNDILSSITPNKSVDLCDRNTQHDCAPNVSKSAPRLIHKMIPNLNIKQAPNLNEKTILNMQDKTVPDLKDTLANLSDAADIEMKSSDNLMQQLEKLFESDNDDDIFDSNLFIIENKINEDNTKQKLHNVENTKSESMNTNDTIGQTEHKPANEGLTLINGMLVNKYEQNVKQSTKHQKLRISKWLCEEYFLKIKLFELFDDIRDNNRCKFIKIKKKMLVFFGCDSDDEGVVSPMEETTDFMTSCKERITPWVVKILTPYYVKGRIKGKAIFKSLVKHLIDLIYQCSKYPYEYEVESFVKDFLESHTMIKCEADFQRFRIENI